jgi:hypothetical protein
VLFLFATCDLTLISHHQSGAKMLEVYGSIDNFYLMLYDNIITGFNREARSYQMTPLIVKKSATTSENELFART